MQALWNTHVDLRVTAEACCAFADWRQQSKSHAANGGYETSESYEVRLQKQDGGPCWQNGDTEKTGPELDPNFTYVVIITELMLAVMN